MTHPCLSCGACCASFRVDFSVHECDSNGGRVPSGLAEEVNAFTCRMRGTDYARPRCAALTGTIGKRPVAFMNGALLPAGNLPLAARPATRHVCAMACRRWKLGCTSQPATVPHGRCYSGAMRTTGTLAVSIDMRSGRNCAITAILLRRCSVASLQLKAAGWPLCHTASACSSKS